MNAPTRVVSITVMAGLLLWGFAALEAVQAQEPSSPTISAGPAPALEEIVVTSRKREESLENVPIAVTALGQADIERLQAVNLADLSYQIPNVGINANQTTANSAQLYMRGVGQDDSSATYEEAIGVYVDGVYLARSQGALLDLGDFERIEVLRGPQGTLYGRNSSGGAISFVTKKPSLTNTNFSADLTLGSFNEADAKVSASTPLITDVLAAKVDFVELHRDGYVTLESTGQDIDRVDRQAFRGALRWQAASAVTVDLAADLSHDRSGTQAPVPLTNGCCLPGGQQPLFGYYISDADTPDLNRYDGGGTSATVTWDLSGFQFKSITAQRRFGNYFWGDLAGRGGTLPLDPDGLNLLRDIDQNQQTQEFQLTSTGEQRLNWVTGLFFFREHIHDLDIFLFRDDWTESSRSYAGYGELNYNVTDALTLTAGGRFTRDQKDFRINAVGIFGPFAVPEASKTWDEFTPKLGISYRVTGGPLLYVTWQEGYKAGAFQAFPQSVSDVINQILPPEKVKAYEVGAKASWLNNRLRTNLALFDTDYTDLQLSVFSSAGAFVADSADAKIRGLELEVTAQPLESLTLSGSVGALHANYTSSDSAQVAIDGEHMQFAPNLQWNIGGEWKWPLLGNFLKVGANYLWVDDVYFDTDLANYNIQKAHDLVNGNVGYEEAHGHWSVTGGVKNATNVKWASTGYQSGGESLFVMPPRTYSVDFRYRL